MINRKIHNIQQLMDRQSKNLQYRLNEQEHLNPENVKGETRQEKKNKWA